MASRKYRSRTLHTQITERDRSVFEYIGTHGCATSEQIRRLFWDGRKLQTCTDRLAQLVRAGFLQTAPTQCRGTEESMFWIGREARLLFPDELRARFDTGRPARAEIAHVLTSNDVEHRLAQRGSIVSWTRERELKSMQAKGRVFGQTPDAHVIMVRDGRRYSFHIEVDGQYHGRMLRDKLTALGQSSTHVLWVVFSERRLRTITNATRHMPNVRPIHFDAL